MNHLNHGLSSFAAVAVVLGLAACSHQQSQAAPNSAENGQQNAQPSAEEYGSANGQPGNTPGPGEMSPSGTQTNTGSYQQYPNAPYGQSGATGTGQAGTTGQANSANGSSGTTYGGQTATGNAGAEGSGTTTGSGTYGSTTGAGGSMGSTSAMGGTTDLSGMSDPQFAAILQNINQGEIQAGQLATTKAKSPDVKRFAQHMVNAHQDMLNRQNGVLSNQHISPAPNAVSQQLKSQAQTQLSTLQGESGANFDRDYIDAQVRDHTMALDLVDRMIPNVKNQQLKSDIESARSHISNHLQEAQRIQQTLQQGSTNQQQQSTPDFGNQNNQNDQNNQNQKRHR